VGSLLECFLRAVTGAGPVVATAVATAVPTAVPTAVATAGPAQATALIKQSKSFPTGVLQLIGIRFVPETDKIRTANVSSVNLHRVPNSVFWWPSITLHRGPKLDSIVAIC
jgi:hypothetical protein